MIKILLGDRPGRRARWRVLVTRLCQPEDSMLPLCAHYLQEGPKGSGQCVLASEGRDLGGLILDYGS